MANVGAITVTIGAETFTLQKDLAKAEAKIRGFTRRSQTGFRRMRQSILSARSSAIALGAVFALLAGKGIGGVFKESIKFEDSLLNLKKVMGDTALDVEDVTNKINKMAQITAASASDVLEGVATFKQAGFTLKESFDLQLIAAKTAVAGNIEVAESATLITRALKGFKAEASEAARLTDIANAISNKYGTSLQELLRGMSRVSGAAGRMGFSMEELSSLLTPMIEIFGTGAEAATAFKTGIAKITGEQPKVKAALNQIQDGLGDTSLLLEDGAKIIRKVILAFDDMDSEAQIFWANQLVGIRQGFKFVEVLSNMSRNAEIHGVALSAAGSVTEEFEVKTSALSFKLKQFGITVARIRKNVGDFLAPSLLKSLASMGNLLNRMTNKGGDLRFVTDGLKLWVSSVLLQFKFIAKEFKNLIQLASSVARIVSKIHNTIANASGAAPFALPKEIMEQRRGIQELDSGSFINTLKRNREASFAQKQREKFALPGGIPSLDKGFMSTLETIRQQNLKSIDERVKREKLAADKLKLSFAENIETIREFNLERQRLTLNSTDFAIKQFDMESMKYKELVDKGLIDADRFRKFVNQSHQDIHLQNNVMFQNMIQAANDFAETATDAIVDWASEAKTSFTDVLTSFFQMLLRMTIQIAIMQPILDRLFGRFGGGTATGVGILGNIFSPLGGGANPTALPASVGGGPTQPRKKFLGIFHEGGIVDEVQTGRLKTDERIIKAQTGEGILSREDMRRLGGAAGFNRLRSGGTDGLTINVPVNVEGNNRLASELRKNIESTVIKVVKEFA